MTKAAGMKKNLANYGDTGFSVFLRKVFLKSMGYSDAAVDRPIIGITNTASGFNACHRMVPDIIEAVSRGISQGTDQTAYAPFTPSNSEQRLPPLYYRGCWHRVSRGFL